MQTQTSTLPQTPTLGVSGLPGVLAAAHQGARANAPTAAQSYSVFYAFLNEQRRGVPTETNSVSTIVKYYNDRRGYYKLTSQRCLMMVVSAIMLLTLFVAVPQHTAMAQNRSDPAAILERAANRIESVKYSLKRLKASVPTRKKSTSTSTRCRSAGNGNTRPRRAC